MRYFLDTEFYERGYARIDLISIALVCEDGREYYAVASDGWAPCDTDSWLRQNVLPQLVPGGLTPNALSRLYGAPTVGWAVDFAPELAPVARTRAVIAGEIREFVGAGKQTPEFWGFFADYDWVLLCQLFGRMIDLPKGWPMYCNDLKQEMVKYSLGKKDLPADDGHAHNALDDARWLREAHKFVMGHRRSLSASQEWLAEMERQGIRLNPRS